MLAIRMQRTGRKGHAQFRVIVQESRRTPTSGNIVAALGSYDPHTKAVKLDVEKAAIYLNNGAQPSQRVAMLLQKEGVKLPDWVKVDSNKKSGIKNTEKLRRNQTPVPVEALAEAEPTEPQVEVEAPVESETETTTSEAETVEVSPEESAKA